MIERHLKQILVPATSVLVMATILSPVADGQKANAAALSVEEELEQEAEASSKEQEAKALQNVELLGGAALEMEFAEEANETEYILDLTPVETEAVFHMPAAGAADEVTLDVIDDEEIKKESDQLIAEAEEEENEYANLALAHVTYDFVNVRTLPGTDGDIVGKMYDGSVAEIIERCEEEDGLWFKVTSGSVQGYIKAEFFYYDEDLINVIDEHVFKNAVVNVNVLNVREEGSMDADRIGYLQANEKVKVLEDDGEWLKVQYTDEKVGYIAAEHVTVQEEYITAKSIEEEQAELEEKKKKQQREQQKNTPAAVQEDVTLAITAPAASYDSNPELRQAIVNYALQYVGNRYVMGGQSLAGGTDCSGFTCFVYREFGYSISRTPSGQLAGSGRPVSLAEIQPGDIVCFGYGGCSHVALYIGNGQIVHEANSRMGCIVSPLSFEPIVGVKRVID